MTLARAEGLEAHRRSVAIRLRPRRREPEARPCSSRPVDPNSKSRLDRHHARRGLDRRAATPTSSTSARWRSSTSSRATVRARRPRRRPLQAQPRPSSRTGWCSRSARRASGDTFTHRAVAHAAAAHHEGLLHGLRKLLPGDPHRAALAHPGDRHGPARRCTTRAAACCSERLKGKITRRPRHRAAAVHAHLRAALEGVRGAARRERPTPRTCRARCSSPAP